MLLGILSPRKPWRWVLLVGVFAPGFGVASVFFLSQKPERARIYESFLAFRLTPMPNMPCGLCSNSRDFRSSCMASTQS
jgi:hypothetical protein